MSASNDGMHVTGSSSSSGGVGPSPRSGDATAAAASARTPRSGRRPGDKLKLRKRRIRSDNNPVAPDNSTATDGHVPSSTASAGAAGAENGTRTPNNRDRGPQQQRERCSGGSLPNSDSSASSSRYFTPGAERNELPSALTGDDVLAIESPEKTEALVNAIEGIQSPADSSLEEEMSAARLGEGGFQPLDDDDEQQEEEEEDGDSDTGMPQFSQQPLTQPTSPGGSAVLDSDSNKDDVSFASANGSSRRPSSSSGQDDVVDAETFTSESRMNSSPPPKDADDSYIVEEMAMARTEGIEANGVNPDGTSMEVSHESYPLFTQPVASDVREAESDSDDFIHFDGYGASSPLDAMNGQEESEPGDDSSCSYSSSSSSDQSNSIDKDLRDISTTPRIIRNRRRNILRNEERLRILMQDVGLPNAGKSGRAIAKSAAENGEKDNRKPTKKKRIRPGSNNLETPNKRSGGNKRRGMLFATNYNGMEPAPSSKRISDTCPQTPIASPGGSFDNKDLSVTDEVSSRFPHRYPQIRLLCSTFNSTIQQSAKTVEVLTKRGENDAFEHCNSYVPPPVFITGPCGAGKTSIVRDILTTLKRRHRASTVDSESQTALSVGEGYINCATIEGTSAGAFLESAYKQILRSFYDSYSRPPKSAKKRKRLKTNKDDDGSRNQEVRLFPAPPGHEFCVGQEVKSLHLDEISKDANGFPPAAGLPSNSARDANAMRPEALVVEDAPMLPVHGESYANAMDDDDFDKEDGDGDMEDLIERQKKDHLRSKTPASISHKKPSAISISSSPLAPVGTSGHQGLAVKSSGRLNETDRQSTGASQSRTLEMNRHHAINTPVEFGRALSFLCGGQNANETTPRRRGCAFLVLDRGERLLSLTAKQNSPYTSIGGERNNLLAQLLLLPKVMGLNLTVIVITTNSLLEFSRTNNIHIQPHLSLGTIQDAIQPIRIRFHAYRGKEIYKSILLQPKMRQLVIGCVGAPVSNTCGNTRVSCQLAEKKKTAALERLYNAMINTVVQSLEGATRDVTEMLRFSRVLWPMYTSPLLSSVNEKFRQFILNVSVEDTSGQKVSCDGDCTFCRAASPINADSGSSVETILEGLDIKARPQIRAMLKNGLFTPIQKFDVSVYPSFSAKPSKSDKNRATSLTDTNHFSSTKQLPYMAKFLLLSAFLCQNNRQDQDLALFTTQKKGQRKKGRGRGATGASENVAYASSAAAQKQLRTLRPTLFPLERMLSVFSSILSKYGTQSVLLKDEIQEDGYIDVAKIGTARLFECVAELRDFGLLRKMSSISSETGQGPIDMAARKYSCTLSYSAAEMIAKDVNFPLDKFLLQDG